MQLPALFKKHHCTVHNCHTSEQTTPAGTRQMKLTGSFLKPCGLTEGSQYTLRDKAHGWRNSIDVFDCSIWANIDQVLTAAFFPQLCFPRAFKALFITAQTHTQKGRDRKQIRNTMAALQDKFSTNTQCSKANALDYQATPVALCKPTRAHEKGIRTLKTMTSTAAVLPPNHHDLNSI